MYTFWLRKKISSPAGRRAPDYHAHNLATSCTYYVVQPPYRPNIYCFIFSTVTDIKLHGVINNIALISLKIGPTNAEALVIASKEAGLEVNSDKTTYMGMSRNQNAERSHGIKIDNNSSERMGQFKYLGTTLTNQNAVQEEIKSRLKSGNACYHLVQNLSSSIFAIQKFKD